MILQPGHTNRIMLMTVLLLTIRLVSRYIAATLQAELILLIPPEPAISVLLMQRLNGLKIVEFLVLLPSESSPGLTPNN